jgi:uncharacterized protein
MAKKTAQVPSPDLEEMLRILRARLPELRERYGVREFWLFGSRVRSQGHRRSDLDVLVDLDDRLSLLQFVALQHYLSDVLRIKVDLVERSVLRPTIGRQVLSEAVHV